MKKAAALSILVVLIVLAVAVMAEAEQPKKVPRVGFLSLGGSGPNRGLDSLRKGLRDPGYVEGKNIGLTIPPNVLVCADRVIR